MPHARLFARSTRTRVLLPAALLASAGLVHGCGDDGAREAVRTANIQFEAIAAGDENSHMEEALAEYREIEALVSEHAGDGSGYAEAAAVGLAQAKLGQAAHGAQQLARSESEATRRIRVLRANLSEYLTLSAIAEAASTYDPNDDLAELGRIIELRRTDADHYAAQKTDIDNQIADLEAKVAVLRARAIADRRQAGEIKLSMIDVSAQRAAELAADAREFTLRADQHDLEADRIMGRVGQLRPTAAEISLNAGNASEQIAMLDRSREEARERARASERDASEARAAAASARDRLAALAEAFRTFRTDTIAQETDRVTRLLRDAESDLSPARRSLQTSAAATRASIQEALGSAWSRRATGHADAAGIYQSLADAGIPGDFANLAQQAVADTEDAKDSASRAFAAAASALRSIRTRGDARDRLEQAAIRLDRLGGNEPEPEFSEEFQQEDADDMGAGDEPEAFTDEDEPAAEDDG